MAHSEELKQVGLLVARKQEREQVESEVNRERGRAEHAERALERERREVAQIGMGGALNKGSSAEWWTPPHIFEALELNFDLDPCAPPGGVPWIPAKRSFSIHDNGLAQPWEGRVFLNPPYGRETAKWVGRLAEHGNGIALVFVRTDAAWAQSALRAADVVCFIAGRLSFKDGSGQQARKGHNAANGSMLLAYGPECTEAVLGCGLGVAFSSLLPGDHLQQCEREVVA